MKHQVALPGIAVPAQSGTETGSEHRADSVPDKTPRALSPVSDAVSGTASEAVSGTDAGTGAGANAGDASATLSGDGPTDAPGKPHAPLEDSATGTASAITPSSELPATAPEAAQTTSPSLVPQETPEPQLPEILPGAAVEASVEASQKAAVGAVEDASSAAAAEKISGVVSLGIIPEPAKSASPARLAKRQHKSTPQPVEEHSAEASADDWPPMSDILQSFFIFEPTTAEPSPITVLGLDCARPRGLPLLTADQRALLQEADVICGGKQLLHELTGAAPEENTPVRAAGSPNLSAPSSLDIYEDNAAQDVLKARLLPLSTPLEPVLTRLSQMRAAGERVVMLADGDPLLFGIGATLVRLLGQEAVRLMPAVSSLQQACARLALPWHKVICLSLHGRDDLGPLNAAVSKNAPLCILTDARMTPDLLARHLLDRGVDWFTAHIFERMGAPDEICHNMDLAQAAGTSFGPACTFILVPGDTPRRARLGLNAHELAVDRGLISKKPVRATALALLQIEPHHVVWDVGSGSGAVALEATVLAHEGRVVAVERSVGRAMSIQENRRRFGAAILDVRLGEAPECLPSLPDPHRVFIGGGLSGEDGEDILGHVCLRLPVGGRVVASCVLLDTFCLCRSFFERLGWPVEICQIQASEGRELGGDIHLAAMNPVFLVTAQKPAPEGVTQKRGHE
ncbi:precorrin-6y C5,15-methyltransferase (decarboxylating) subunit CbiE [Desulfovibrio intestinalis]|uniref:Precorrin-6Y C5,15-methyltransferase (Decarboxylating) n=1 Tax=Desulfovibrio intestinalis TaxID=58621 RepID=A0A7W8C2Q4_9BACT|nr:precorrin-6y C5,15-methyltransferase (decarboxylating) subunit CbiE [Desulfovibrio intestinalis]MBB5144532.1 precorrin-6Y C5,15-methyltransferase (decarboxylating) [Desulfovibrio intestinalis]